MSKKLTLRLDEDVIDRAKAYADERGMSVSELVEQYFDALTATATSSETEKKEQKTTDSWKEELAPFTRSLLGRASSGEDVDEDAYYQYLEEKHQY